MTLKSNNVKRDYSRRHSITFKRPPLSGDISHEPKPETTLGMTLDYTTILSYCSLKFGCRTYLTTHVKREKKKYMHVFPSFTFFIFIFEQVIAQKLNKTKLGSTLLGDIPSEVVISVAVIFGGQAIS